MLLWRTKKKKGWVGLRDVRMKEAFGGLWMRSIGPEFIWLAYLVEFIDLEEFRWVWLVASCLLLLYIME